jgi:hypothetical protein
LYAGGRGRCGGRAPARGVAEALPRLRQGWSEGGTPPSVFLIIFSAGVVFVSL